MNKSVTKSKKKKITLSVVIIFAVLIYVLFAFKRIKNSFSFVVDNVIVTNEIWFLPLLILIKVYFDKNKTRQSPYLNFYDGRLLLLIFLLISVTLIGGFKANNLGQYLFALNVFLIPLMFIHFIKNDDLNYLDFIIKGIVILCLGYSLLAIIASTNYADLMKLIGNPIDVRYYYQYRPSLMLGSSISVSYYFNISLPFCFYINYTTTDKKWKIISLIAIVLNLFATAILLSRLAFMVSIIVLLYYLFIVKREKNYILPKMGTLVALIIAGLYAIKKYDLTRLLVFFNDESTLSRLSAIKYGLSIFSDNIFFGKGLGRIYHRVNPLLARDAVDGIAAFEPHNTVVLSLSEIGIIGSIILLLIFMRIFFRFKYIKDNILRSTAYIVVIAYVLGAMGGSHLFNEISFSTILWIYISLFRTISIRDFNLNSLSTEMRKEQLNEINVCSLS